MSLIKNAITYRADIPTDATDLHNHLTERSFLPPSAGQERSSGFIPREDNGCTLVSTFPGGLAFHVRIDEKIIPTSAVAERVKFRIGQILIETGRKPGKNHRAEIKQIVRAELCATAPCRTTLVAAFYDIKSRFLMVATSSKKTADIVTSLLVNAVGSIKTETINISSIKMGLTTRLKGWLPDPDLEMDGDSEAFGQFSPLAEISMSNPYQHRITIKGDTLESSEEAIREAFKRQFGVTSMKLSLGTCSFKLTDAFQMRSISIPEDEGSEAEDFEQLAFWEVTNLVSVLDAICLMFAYVPPEDEAGQAETEAGEVKEVTEKGSADE